MVLYPELNQQVVNFLMPYLPDIAHRQSIVTNSFYKSRLLDQIDWEGSSYIFTSHLVKTLDDWGQFQAGVHALEILLREIYLQVGVDRQIECQKLISDIHQSIHSSEWKGSPFPGLRFFDVEDEPIYFGREQETHRLINHLRNRRFVAVTGPSGSGKSSLVNAGVIPRLLRAPQEEWHIIRFKPDQSGSQNPFASLRFALDVAWQLPDLPKVDEFISNPNLLLELCQQNPQKNSSYILFVIDQFEELFTTIHSNYISPFIETIQQVLEMPTIHVLLTLRSDFYSNALELANLGYKLEEGSFPLAPIPPALALGRMLTRPAEIARMTFEPDLVEKIVEDTGKSNGALALMAYVLDELYKIVSGRQDRRILFEDYESLGGIKGAIGKRAEEVFHTSRFDQDTLYSVFRELVDVGSTYTRRRVPQNHFTTSQMKLIEILKNPKVRLLVSDEGMIEVAHEALFTHWPRLSDWLDRAKYYLALIQQFEREAEDWNRRGQPSSLRPRHEKLLYFKEARQILNIDRLSELLALYTEPETDRLLLEITDIHTTHQQRRDIGDRLSIIGDPRPHTGLFHLDNGISLPDIGWIFIESEGDVEIEYGEMNNKKKQFFSVKPFYIAKYLVTYSQYEIFVQATDGYYFKEWWKDFPSIYQPQSLGTSSSQQSNHPRGDISWYQCVAFTRWLDAQYRKYGLFSRLLPEQSHVSNINSDEWIISLPTEWEWLWVAQNGDEKRQYSWGDWDHFPRANTREAGINLRTTAVGMYPHGSSATGVMDMSGNVWEWCLNSYGDPNIIGNSEPENAKVLKGGACHFDKGHALNHVRSLNSSYYKENAYYYGMRLAVSKIF